MKIIDADNQLRRTIEALNRHASMLAPVGSALFMWLMTLEGEMRPWSTGPNSWFVTLPDGRRFYFSGNMGHSVIYVKRSKRGQVIESLRTPLQVQQWVKSLRAKPLKRVA